MTTYIRTNLFSVKDLGMFRKNAREVGLHVVADLSGQLFSISGNSRKKHLENPNALAEFFHSIRDLVTSRVVARVIQSGTVDWYVIEDKTVFFTSEYGIYCLLCCAPNADGNPLPDLLTPVDEIFPLQPETAEESIPRTAIPVGNVAGCKSTSPGKPFSVHPA
jgi:hypothetical protein